jgi:hypothetical protein
VRVPLNPAGASYLRRPHGKVLTVRYRLRDADGALAGAYSVRLR